MIRIRWVGWLALLVSLLTACANVSRFEKGALVAHGEKLDGASEPLYYSISIDGNQVADAHIRSGLLKLAPDAPPLSIGALRPAAVAAYLPRFVAPPAWPEHWKKKAAEEEAYSGGGFHIRFKDGRLISIGICSHCAGGRESPVVGAPEGQALYTLPLTKQQLTEVFGEADRIGRVSEVRY